jgi:hypothetical protein
VDREQVGAREVAERHLDRGGAEDAEADDQRAAAAELGDDDLER